AWLLTASCLAVLARLPSTVSARSDQMSTYEEVRDAMVDILSGREQVPRMPQHWVELQNETALALDRRAGRLLPDQHGLSLVRLSADDAELVRDVFWDLFR